ncbi:MAG: IS21 family transposase [Candidatus Eiseniibacteriota bacterium]
MIGQEGWMEIKLMHRQGVSIRAIARRTGLSRDTVRKILKQVAPKRYGPRAPRATKLSPFVARLEELLVVRPHAPATVLYEAIAEKGYTGHYEQVKRWVRGRRREESAKRRACVRFETAPGVEAQFDWKGPARGLLEDDPTREVHFFRFLLAWSRARWTLVVPSLKLPSVLASLRWGFERAGGVTERLVLDNPKTAVLKPKPRLKLHPFFLDFCRHYGAEPDPAWPYHPERKGKTERSFRDLVDAGILERTYANVSALQAAVTAVDSSRMSRVHATTGERPADRLERERAELLSLPLVPFDPRLPESRRVLTDCTVSFEGAFYSVPHQLVGSRVVVKVDPWGESIEVFAQAERVATHRRGRKGERVILEEHVAELRKPRFERLRERADQSQSLRRQRSVEELIALVAWPRVEVQHRPIEEYAEALGGAR